MRSDPHALLTEVAMSFELDSWLLVGGLMVKRPGFRSESQQGESEHAQEVQSRAA